jgi:4-amino-4-deoxy-L-arabinose transferase-like glycosyltransferase
LSEPEPSPSSPPRDRARLGLRLSAGALLVGCFVALVAGLASAGTPGSDESLNAFTALRLGTALSALDLGAFWTEFHRPDYYPPLGRLGMALGFLFGAGFTAPRVATAVAWFLTIGLAALLARRVAGARAADAASFWTVAGGVTCYLGIDYARGAYSEPWSALSTIASVLLYLRARDTRSRAWALACGLSLGGALLVKYTYGLYIVGAVGLSGLWDLWRRPRDVRPGLLAGWCALGMLAVLLWWFVLPLPKGFGVGQAHWRTFIEYLDKAKNLSTLGPGALLVFWPYKGCLSPLVFLLQLAGIAWGLLRWRHPAERMCAILAVVGPLGYVAYPFRIDRFLMPTFFAAWVLAAAVVARAQGRLAPGVRPLAGAALVLLAWATLGAGARFVYAHVPVAEVRDPERAAALPAWHRPYQVVPDVDAALDASTRLWRNPYRPRAGPATGPGGLELVLHVLAANVRATEPFAWIGGTGTELPYALLDWSVYRAQRDRAALYYARDPAAYFWEDPGFDEAAFRAWASTYARVGVLDPPDPKARPRPFEVHYVAWMRAHPGFEEAASLSLELEVRPGDERPFRVVVYRRLP